MYVIGGSRDFESHAREENTNEGELYKLNLETFEWSHVQTTGIPPIASNRPVCVVHGDVMYYSGNLIYLF